MKRSSFGIYLLSYFPHPHSILIESTTLPPFSIPPPSSSLSLTRRAIHSSSSFSILAAENGDQGPILLAASPDARPHICGTIHLPMPGWNARNLAAPPDRIPTPAQLTSAASATLWLVHDDDEHVDEGGREGGRERGKMDHKDL